MKKNTTICSRLSWLYTHSWGSNVKGWFIKIINAKKCISVWFFFLKFLFRITSLEKKWSIVSWILIRENIVWKFWIHVCFYLKVKRLEGLLSRCKETIRSNKEKSSQLEEENAKLTNEIKELTKLKVHHLVMSSEDWQL